MKTKRNPFSAANLKVLILISVFAAFTVMSYPYSNTNNSGILTTVFANPDSIYAQVDAMPLFTGGDKALADLIVKNITYPPDAKKKGIQGRVIVKFVVNKDGSVSGAEVVQGVSPSLDAEALRVIGTLPRFEKPGFKAGRVVRVYYMLPITFALK